MPEVLRLEVSEDVGTPLGSPTPVLDPPTAKLVEQAAATARRQGRREGEKAGRAAADQAAKGVLDAVRSIQAELAAQRAEALRASAELAQLLATAVLDATPPPDALAVLDRVREAVAGLDDDHLEVHLNRDDHAMLTADESVFAGQRLTLVADRALKPGEARIVGSFGGAELTRAALLAAAMDVFAAGAT